MPESGKVRTYTKHDPADIAKKAAKLGSGFTVAEIGGSAVVRRAVAERVIAPLKHPKRSGMRGRPATRYSLTPRGRGLAKRA